MKFLNKIYTKAIFSEDATLNVVAKDMGEAQISLALEDSVVKRLGTATGTVGSLSIFVAAQVTISILKTSPVTDLFLSRAQKNGYIGGSLTIYDDTNRPWTLTDVSLNTAQFPDANGSDPAISIVLDGNCQVNTEALIGI